MANVSVYRRLSNVLQGKTKANRCVACMGVSVAQNLAGSLELPSPDARKPQQIQTYQLSALSSDVGVPAN
jgi:hypothetical protein